LGSDYEIVDLEAADVVVVGNSGSGVDHGYVMTQSTFA
jgi:hypothetical protein